MQKFRFELFTGLVCLCFFIIQRDILLTYSLDPDEIFSWTLSTGGFVDLIQEVLKHCQQFVYYISLKIWMSVFPSNDYWVRVPSVIAGMGSIVALMSLGRRVFGESHLFLQGIFLFLFPQFVFYSNYARPYAFLLLFVSVNLYFLHRYYFSEVKSRRDLHIFLSTLILTIFTHHIGFIYLAAVVLALLIYKKKIASRFELIPYELVLVLYFILVLKQKAFMGNAVSWIEPLHLSSIPTFFVANKLFLIFYLLPLLGIVGLVRTKKWDSFPAFLLGIIGIFIVGIAAASILVTPLFTHRHFYVLLPCIFILTLYGYESLDKFKPIGLFLFFIYLISGGHKLYTDKIHFYSRLDTKHFLKNLNMNVEIKDQFHCVQYGGAASLIKNYSIQYYGVDLCKTSSNEFEGDNILLIDLQDDIDRKVPSEYKRIYSYQAFSIFKKN